MAIFAFDRGEGGGGLSARRKSTDYGLRGGLERDRGGWTNKIYEENNAGNIRDRFVYCRMVIGE